MTNYLAAWRQHYPCEVIVFVDNKHESFLRIPCPPVLENATLDDEYLFKHLYHIYNLSKIQGGLIMALIPKSLIKVDIIEVCHKKDIVDSKQVVQY